MNFSKSSLVILLSLSVLSIQAQDSYSLQEKIYQKAAGYGDFSVAKQALYTMMELKPENTSLLDSLAILYFQSQAYAQSVFVANDILASKPNNANALEIKAISQSALGLGKEALADYEKLYTLNKNILYVYKIATLQYQLKRMGECEQSINAILLDPKADSQKVPIVYGNRGEQQQIGLKAACLNMKGVLYKDLGKNELAKLQFEEALKLEQNFVLAKGNLDALNKLAATEASTTSAEIESTTEASSSGSKKKKKR